MNRSPIISASKVSQTGFLIRSPMILLFRKYSSLWSTTRKISAAIAMRGEMVIAIPTMTELLIKFPTMGNSPQRKVRPTTKVRYLSETASTNMAVKSVLIPEIRSCAPITVSKLS